MKLLAKESGLPILHGNILRIDLRVNIALAQPVKEYLNLFEETPRWIKNVHRASVRYTRGNQDFYLYDKRKELFKNSPGAYHLIRHDNILRAEYRLKKGLKQSFKFDQPVKVVHLLSSSFRNALALKFIKQYLTLQSRLNWTFPEVNSVSDLKNLTYFLGIKAVGGLRIFMEKVNELRRLKGWEYNKTATVRQWVNRVLECTSAIQKADLIAEVNKKITSAFSSSDLFTLGDFPTSPLLPKSHFKAVNFAI